MAIKRHPLILQIPIHPGALQLAVGAIAKELGNINRIHYERGIDPQIVFFEITCDDKSLHRIRASLDELGYLQKDFSPVASAKLTVRLPHEPGALSSLLKVTTESKALITSIAFDDAGSVPDTVVITLDMKETDRARSLVDALSCLFQLEEIRFDGLEDTSFYVQFARKLIPYIPHKEDGAVVNLITEVNRAAQDLMRLGEDPKEVFRNVEEVAKTIARTCDGGFFADIQTKRLSDTVQLYCIQPPQGGNVYLLSTDDEIVMLDTGYGAYHLDMLRLFRAMDIDLSSKLSKIVISHADADHCGGAGFFNVKTLMHAASLKTIQSENRAWGSPRESMILETVYSKMIVAVSKFRPPKETNVVLFEQGKGDKRGAFLILTEIAVGDLRFEILESFGGHHAGLVFLYCPNCGYLFSADSLVPIFALSEERCRYNRLADSLMTSVNVDPGTARKERQALMDIAISYRREHNAPCTVFSGHGPICIEQEGTLITIEPAPIRQRTINRDE
jgi:glyoxylase-like metal-dependent hydrolase (beta-lactamase superfamily II)